MGKNVTETNHRLKKYRKQNDLIYINNANINEVRLGVKKAPPKYLRYLSNVWLGSDTTRHKSGNCKKVQLIFKQTLIWNQI